MLGQRRAAAAHSRIQEIKRDHAKDSKERKDYASAAQKLPVLIRTAGLCQALHFLKSRSKDEDRSIIGKLLTHLAEQLQWIDAAIISGDSLCERARQAGLSQYLWMTREALAVAEWYARLAQSELEIPRGGDK